MWTFVPILVDVPSEERGDRRLWSRGGGDMCLDMVHHTMVTSRGGKRFVVCVCVCVLVHLACFFINVPRERLFASAGWPDTSLEPEKEKHISLWWLFIGGITVWCGRGLPYAGDVPRGELMSMPVVSQGRDLVWRGSSTPENVPRDETLLSSGVFHGRKR